MTVGMLFWIAVLVFILLIIGIALTIYEFHYHVIDHTEPGDAKVSKAENESLESKY